MTPLFLGGLWLQADKAAASGSSKRYHPWLPIVAGVSAMGIAIPLSRVLDSHITPLPQGLVPDTIYGAILYGLIRLFLGAAPQLLRRSWRLRLWGQPTGGASPSSDSSDRQEPTTGTGI